MHPPAARSGIRSSKRFHGWPTKIHGLCDKRMARAFGVNVCKTVQEILHFRTPMHEWRTSDQLEHLEEMEAASRAVFERHKKLIRDELS